jgi:ABC-type transport system involved in cytochrome bd biosynthesis fused ATPase/permease subunit
MKKPLFIAAFGLALSLALTSGLGNEEWKYDQNQPQDRQWYELRNQQLHKQYEQMEQLSELRMRAAQDHLRAQMQGQQEPWQQPETQNIVQEQYADLIEGPEAID